MKRKRQGNYKKMKKKDRDKEEEKKTRHGDKKKNKERECRTDQKIEMQFASVNRFQNCHIVPF